MPNAKIRNTVKIAILISDRSIVSLSLLMRDLFLRANPLVGEELGEAAFEVQLVSAKGGPRGFGDVAIKTSAPRGKYDFLIIPPLSQSQKENLRISSDDVKLIQRFHQAGTCIASACLGSLLIADAGLLEKRRATTHWRWDDFAKARFGNVEWRTSEMICDESSVITAGGYLSAIDLALYLIAKSHGRAIAHELGRVVLADSIRQKQSVYAKQLIHPRAPGTPFHKLELWLSSNLKTNPTVEKMARLSGMSLRTFHREFQKGFGITPKKFIQLKRIEKVQELLRRTDLSTEEAISRVGVSDISSFRKVFQRELGMSPAEFRRKTLKTTSVEKL